MSRLARKPIIIPPGVEVRLEGMKVFMKGPKGELARQLPRGLEVQFQDQLLTLKPSPAEPLDKKMKSLWGTYASHIKNMLVGVTTGFGKQLELQGIGFRASLSGRDLTLSLGFSHPVIYKAPEGINFNVDKNIITVSGLEKEKVGQAAAELRALKPPEPYKGKGIRYLGEVVRQKAGKKAVSAAS